MIDYILEDAKEIIGEREISFYFNKVILVTGASGLIGSYLISVLTLLLDERFPPKKIISVSRSGKFTIKIDPRIEILCGDITDSTILNQIPICDVIFHAAGYGQPAKFLEDQIKTIALNTESTYRLISKLTPAGDFLFFSTSEVYSGLSNPPFTEDKIGVTNTNHPRAAYIEGKRCGEAISNVAKNLGYNAKNVRLALAYGPGVKDGDSRVLNSFVQQALEKNKIVLQDPGEAWRTYIYISDAIRLALIILERGEESIYNLGGVSRIQIKDLAYKIGMLTNSEVEVPGHQNQFQIGAPDDVWLNMEKTLLLTENYRFIELEEGLKKTVNWQLNKSK